MHWLEGTAGELLPVSLLGAVSFAWVFVVTHGRWPVAFVGGCACGALVGSSVSAFVFGTQLSADLAELFKLVDRPDPEARAALLFWGEVWAVVLTVLSTVAAAVGSGVAAVVAAVRRRGETRPGSAT